MIDWGSEENDERRADPVMVERLAYRGPDPDSTSSERRQALRLLHRNDPTMAYADMARQVGVSNRTVERMADREGWGRRYREYDSDWILMEIRKTLDADPRASMASVARRLGINTGPVHRVYRQSVAAGTIQPRSAPIRRTRFQIRAFTTREEG